MRNKGFVSNRPKKSPEFNPVIYITFLTGFLEFLQKL